MADRPLEEVTFQSSNAVKSVTQVTSMFGSREDLARLRPSLHIPNLPKDYELMPCGTSNQLTEDPSKGFFYMFETLFTRVKLDLPFPLFYYAILLVLRVLPV